MSKINKPNPRDRMTNSLIGGKHGESSSVEYNEVIASASEFGDSKQVVNVATNLLKDAPDDLNFFPKVSHGKFIEMMFSIQENGLFNPIIIWEYQYDNKENENFQYMILSGHNRVHAYKTIVETYKSNPDFDTSRYEEIPAFIFGKDEIDIVKAKEIIIDTNYIQREKEDERRIMPLIVKSRMDIVKNRKDIEGRTVDAVAKDLGVSGTKVYEDYLIATKIIPELNELYFNFELKKKPLLRFALFDFGIQYWILDTFKDSINDENASKLRKGMNKEEIEICFTEEEDKEVNVTLKMPESLREEFLLMSKAWLRDKIK